jgi:hypothetical protein
MMTVRFIRESNVVGLSFNNSTAPPSAEFFQFVINVPFIASPAGNLADQGIAAKRSLIRKRAKFLPRDHAVLVRVEIAERDQVEDSRKPIGRIA